MNNFSDGRAYMLSPVQSPSLDDNFFNPIAQGISLFPDDKADAEPLLVWGNFSWFDLFNSSMHTVRLRDAFEVSSGSYKLTTLDGRSYWCQRITRELFDERLRPLFQMQPPPFKSDEEVQSYLQQLSCY